MNLKLSGIATAALLLMSAAAHAQTVTDATSKHNLTTGGAGQIAVGDQVCVFCHTPHGADTGTAVPLWNRTLPNPASYTRYSTVGTVTLDGAEAPVGSVSLACLSCHDGTQALDAVINSPGPGLGTPGAGATMTPALGPVPNLTPDLSDDHPVSIQFAGGGYTDDQAIAATGPQPKVGGDADFNAPMSATINGFRVWWVDSETPAGNEVRDKTDMILYTRAALPTTPVGTVEPFVECGSCHDPHNAATGASATQVQFMRTQNDASAVCIACHVK